MSPCLLLPLLGLMLATPVADGVAASPPPDVAAQVWLKGPFGRVPGADPAAPAGAAPDGAPLDAWIRSAPLSLDVRVPGEVVDVSVTADPREGDGAAMVLSSEELAFSGPDVPGVVVIVATLEGSRSGTSQHAWLVEVPDREGGVDALLEIPGPEVLLRAGDETVAGEPGDGCFAYLCVTAGREPPPASLPPFSIGVGEVPSIALGDGSAIVGWKGTLRPLDDISRPVIAADAAFPTAPRADPRLDGLAVPAAGAWLLRLEVEYDRERGWGTFSYRLVAE